MDKVQRLHEENARAVKARELLENTLYIEAMERLEAAITDKWKNCAIDNRDQREYAFLMISLLKQFKAHFESLVQRGVMAEEKLAQLKKNKILGII